MHLKVLGHSESFEFSLSLLVFGIDNQHCMLMVGKVAIQVFCATYVYSGHLTIYQTITMNPLFKKCNLTIVHLDLIYPFNGQKTSLEKSKNEMKYNYILHILKSVLVCGDNTASCFISLPTYRKRRKNKVHSLMGKFRALGKLLITTWFEFYKRLFVKWF